MKKKNFFLAIGIFSCICFLCLILTTICNIDYANAAKNYEVNKDINMPEGKNYSYKQELPKSREDVHSGKFAIDSDDPKVIASYIEHCMDVVASEPSFKVKKSTSLIKEDAGQWNFSRRNAPNEFLFYKITAEPNYKNTLHIALTDRGGYTKFDSATVPWYDSRYSINSVVVEDEMFPKSTAAWFGCMNTDNAGPIKGSNVQSFVGINKIHLPNDSSFMFTGCNFAGSTGTIDALPQDLENVLYADSMFDFTTFPDDLLQNAVYGLKNATNRYYCFANNVNLTKAVLDRENSIDNKSVNFSYMFRGNPNLSVVEGIPKNLNSESTTQGMFRLCDKLTKIYAEEGTNWSKVKNSDKMFDGCNALIGGCGSNISSGEITGACAKADGGEDDEGYFTVKNVNNEAVWESDANVGRLSINNSNGDSNFVTDQGTFKVNSKDTNQICFYKDGDAATENESSKTDTITSIPEIADEYSWQYSYNGKDWFDIDNEKYYPVKDSGVTIKATFKLQSKKILKIPTWIGDIVYDTHIHDVSYLSYLYWDDFNPDNSFIRPETSHYKEINAGTYTVNFSLWDKKNYIWEDGTTNDQTRNWEIKKADWTVDPYPKGQLVGYSSSPVELLKDLGECRNEDWVIQKIFYALGTKDEPLEDFTRIDNPTAIDNGIYYIWYQVKGDRNHNEYTCRAGATPQDGGPAISVVYKDTDKTTRIIYPPEGKELYYASDEDMVTPGVCVFGEMQYALGSKDRMPDVSEFSPNIPTATNHLPGTYYIWYYAKHRDEFPNFTDSEFGCVETVIHPGQAEVVQPPNPYTLEYNASPQTIASNGVARGGTMLYAVTDSKTAPAISDYHSSIEQKMYAGKYYIHYYVKGYEGYEDSQSDYVEAEITKANLEITIAGNSAQETYNGCHFAISGYVATADNVAYYSESKILSYANAYAEGVDVGAYWMGLEAKYFAYDDNNVNATFNVVDGCLVILMADLNIEITGNSDEVVYDGNFHTVEGFSSIERNNNYLFDSNLVKYDGNTKIEEKDVKRNGAEVVPYLIVLNNESFSYDNPNVKASFSVISNVSLKIKPAELSIEINGNSDTVVYDGNEHTVQGYSATCDNNFFDQSKLTYSGSDSITQTNVNFVNGVVLPYTLALDKNAFSYDDNNVAWKISNENNMQPISLTIAQAEFRDIVSPEPYRGSYQGPTDLLTQDGSFNPASEGTMQYGLGTQTAPPQSYSAEHPVGNAVGVYYVWYRIVANTHNYKDYAADQPVIAIIENETDNSQIVVAPKGKTITYGTDDTLAIPGAAVFGEILYAISTSQSDAPADNEFSNSIPTGLERMEGNRELWRDHGTYYIWYYAKGTDGHQDSQKANVESKIIPAQIDIAISGNVDACQYDGNYHTVSGYTVRASSNFYNPDYFTTDYRNEELAIVEKDVHYVNGAVIPYDKILDETKFHYSDPSGNVVVNNQPGHGIVIEGDISLTIYPATMNIIVYGNTDTVIYDAQYHEVSGYELECDNLLFNENYVSCIGGAIAWGIDAGIHPGLLTSAAFSYNSPGDGNNIKATFVIARDVLLTITPAVMEIVVNGNTEVKTYTGSLLTSEGYNATSLNPAFDPNKVEYFGVPIASRVEIGIRTTRLDKVLFRYADPNVFANFTVVLPVSLTVISAHADINITGNSATCEYDGSRHTVSGYSYEFAPGSPSVLLPAIVYLGSDEAAGVDAGVYSMNLDSSRFISANPNIYCTFHIVEDGQLIIDPAHAQINVIGNSTITTYNGHEQTSEGFTVTSNCRAVRLEDVRYSGNSSVSATDVNLVNDRVEPYYANLDASQFSYNDPNVDATFSISSNVSLLIQKASWIVDTYPVGCFEKVSPDQAVSIPLITEKGKYKAYSDTDSVVDINIYCEGTQFVPNNQWTEETLTELLPGEYFVWYKILADNNHNDYVSLTPVKAILTENNDAYITVHPTPCSIPYSSSDPMVTEGTAERGDIRYACTVIDVQTPPSKDDFTLSVPTGKIDDEFRDAGEYRIWYYASDKSQYYNDSEIYCINSTITKIFAEYEREPIINEENYYDGHNHCYFIKAPGIAKHNLKCMYGCDIDRPGVDGSHPDYIYWTYDYSSIHSETSSGLYWVYDRVQGDKNHYDSPIRATMVKVYNDEPREIRTKTTDVNLIVNNYPTETIYFERYSNYLDSDYLIGAIVEDQNICTATAVIDPHDFRRIIVTINAVAGGSTKLCVAVGNDYCATSYSEYVNINVDYFTYQIGSPPSTGDSQTSVSNNEAQVATAIKYVGAYNCTSPDETVHVPEQITLKDGTTYKVVALSKINDYQAIMTSKYAQYIALNKNITTIDNNVFYSTPIVSVSDTSSLKTIGQSAFENCSQLSQFGDSPGAITLSDKLNYIGASAFKECISSSLTKIDMSHASAISKLFGNTFMSSRNPFKFISIKINDSLNNLSYTDFMYTKTPETNNLIYDDEHTAVLSIRELFSYPQKRFAISDDDALNKNVRLIASNVLSCSINLKKVVIDKPNNFQIYINDYAFGECAELETIFVKDSRIKYGENVIESWHTAPPRYKDLVFGGNLTGNNVNIPTGDTNRNFVKLQQTEYNPLNPVIGSGEYVWIDRDIYDAHISSSSSYCAFDVCGHYVNGTKNADGTEGKRIFSIDDKANFYLLDTGPYIDDTTTSGQIKNACSSSAEINGGGLYTTNGTIKVYDANFKNCYSYHRMDSSANSKGGAIAIGGSGSLYIFCANFDENEAYIGGAISCSPASMLYLEHASFKNDKAYLYGGAIYSECNNNDIHYCTFSKNNSENCGGAIYATPGSKFSITDCSFDKNTCKDCGGALDMSANGKSGTSLYIYRCSFNENSASTGGAIHLTGEVQFTIDYSYFTNNYTFNDAGNGGAILISDTQNGNSIDGCNFTNNHAKSGGALYSYEGYLKFYDNDFTNNSCKVEGGAVDMVHCDDHSINFDSCDFNNNSTDTEGGAVEIQGAKSGGKRHYFNDCNFDSNTAKDDGGAVYVDMESSHHTSVEFHECDFNQNRADDKGGAIFNEGYNYIYNSNFIKNYAGGYGGAIHIDSHGEVDETKNTLFDSNTAHKEGGAICIDTNTWNGVFGGLYEYCGFINNKCDGYIGGAMVITFDAFSCQVDIKNCGYWGNSCAFSGSSDAGALGLYGDDLGNEYLWVATCSGQTTINYC